MGKKIVIESKTGEEKFFDHVNKSSEYRNFVREIGCVADQIHREKMAADNAKRLNKEMIVTVNRQFAIRMIILVALLISNWGIWKLTTAALIAPVLMSILLPVSLMASGWVAREALEWARRKDRIKRNAV